MHAFDTTTYALTVSNSDGSDSCTVKVTVEPPEQETPSCDSFTVSPTSLPYGGTVTLTWATTNADTVTTINQGIGTVSDDGSTTDSLLTQLRTR
ncbi:MAG: hypothetical protein R3B69_02070 [Candidatus Paceibacterota bacterium]